MQTVTTPYGTIDISNALSCSLDDMGNFKAHLRGGEVALVIMPEGVLESALALALMFGGSIVVDSRGGIEPVKE